MNERRAGNHTSKKNKCYGYHSPNSLLLIKEVPEEMLMLRRELAQPQNYDLLIRASEGATFEECIGNLAADLNILLDGDYDVPELCEVLLNAVRARHNPGVNKSPHKVDKRLKNVEIIEDAEKFEIIESAQKNLAPGRFTICLRCQTSFDCINENCCKLDQPEAVPVQKLIIPD